MSSTHPSDFKIDDVVREARIALDSAESHGLDAPTLDALRHCVQWLESSHAADDSVHQFDGYVDYTIDDEDCEPHGRQFDIRVYYCWEDYDPADGPQSTWGASVEHCEVLAVRYFDDHGNPMSSGDYHQDAAQKLIEQNYHQITEVCTEAGYRNGVGESNPRYSPPELRMAPSSRTRGTERQRRDHG